MTDDEIQKLAVIIAQQCAKAELSYPFGDDIPVFKVMGKVFMLTSTLNGKKFVNLKVDPDESEMLRDTYSSIRVGYHMNKRHWISIFVGKQIHVELIEDLVKASYELVVSKLTKKQQQTLAVHAQIK